MKDLYKHAPRAFYMYDFQEKPGLDYSARNKAPKDYIVGTSDNKRCEIHIMENKATCEIFNRQELEVSKEFAFSTDEEALNNVFNFLNEYGQESKVIFTFNYSLFTLLDREYGNFGPREITVGFINYFKKNGTNLIVLMEANALGDLSKYESAKTITDKLLKKAPNISRIIVKFLKDPIKYSSMIMTYYAEKVAY